MGSDLHFPLTCKPELLQRPLTDFLGIMELRPHALELLPVEN